MKVIVYETERGWVVRGSSMSLTFETKTEATAYCDTNSLEYEDITNSIHQIKKKRKKREAQ